MPQTARPEPPAGLRRVTDDDAEALIALIGAAYAEYPGCVLDLPGIDDDLPVPGTTAARRGSPWWIVEVDGQLVGTIGAGRLQADGSVELKRLYVAHEHRGHGLATRLIAMVEQQAAGLGATTVELWTDTRFEAAHHRYRTLGFAPTGEQRDLHDPSDTTEYRFVKAISPAPPLATATWRGPFRDEVATLSRLPDGWSLRTSVPDQATTASVEVDASWATRHAEVTVDGVSRVLTSDGAGTWWRDGEPAADLAGAEDVDIEVSPLTNTLPIRRLLAADVDDAEVTAAWVRVPGTAIEPLVQRYTRTGEGTWRYRALSGFEAELAVDEHGLVDRYGDLWTRV